jgi:putative tryptophan/tyrosine transport system substrate-binding protein
MERRKFITLVGGAAAAWPLAARIAEAQQRSRSVIGFLGPQISGFGHFLDDVASGLRQLGYQQGRDYVFEERYAEGDMSRLPALAEELVRLKPNVIIVPITVAALAARKATSDIPIVGVSLADPVGIGLVLSEAHPGTNVTGIRSWMEGLGGKQVSIALELLPGAKKIGLLSNLDNPYGAQISAEVRTAASTAGLVVTPFEVQGAEPIAPAFELFREAQVDIVIVVGDSRFLSEGSRIAERALQFNLPTLFSFRENVENGGCLSYGVNVQQNFRRAAYFVDRILRGEKPSDLPIEFPTKLELIVNMKTMRALGLTVPPTLLARADEVIE